MPVIKIEYDEKVIDANQARNLSIAVQKIVSEETKIKEVMVYTNTSQIKIQVDPIEIFIEMSAHKIDDRDDLIKRIKTRIQNWKAENSFTTLINLTVIPMDWNLEIGF